MEIKDIPFKMVGDWKVYNHKGINIILRSTEEEKNKYCVTITHKGKVINENYFNKISSSEKYIKEVINKK